jgi:acyl transferase domain-containing protein
MASGGALSVIAGRLAYFLGTQGPAVVVDTACSSSLVAIHQACRSLRQRESRLAIAGGVSTILLPELTVNFSQARMLSPDGRCKTFDAAADGYVRGEGCGIVVLKRLSDALAEGDRVMAVIRGSAMNQDGRSSGLTVPNGIAQEAVIAAAPTTSKRTGRARRLATPSKRSPSPARSAKSATQETLFSLDQSRPISDTSRRRRALRD